MNRRCFSFTLLVIFVLAMAGSGVSVVLSSVKATNLDNYQGQVTRASHADSKPNSYSQDFIYWMQSNTDGFGDVNNHMVASTAPFQGHLYAGVYNTGGSGGQLWRLESAGWMSVTLTGFGNSANQSVDALAEFNGKLYAGVWNEVDGGEMWRSDDGGDWVQIASSGFGDPTNYDIFSFGIYSDTLYATTWSITDTHGAEIWRSATGDALDWSQVVNNGFDGDANNAGIPALEVYSNYLYVGTFNDTTGGEVWRTSNGTDWFQVNTDGFGDNRNAAVNCLIEFDGFLYASTYHFSGEGFEVWRCQVCSGSDWQQVVNNGFGNSDTRLAPAIRIFNGRLYVFPGNGDTGLEVWWSSDGLTWEQVGFGGFGDSNNVYTYWDNAVSVFDGKLFVGTFNSVTGGEIWFNVDHVAFLPLVVR